MFVEKGGCRAANLRGHLGAHVAMLRFHLVMGLMPPESDHIERDKWMYLNKSLCPATAGRRHRRSTLQILVLAVVGLLAGCGSVTPEERMKAAEAFLAEGRVQAGIIELKNLLKANPEHLEGRRLLGETYQAVRDYPSALKELGRALAQQPSDVSLESDLLRIRTLTGDAEAVLDELQARDLDDALLILRRGEAALSLGRVDVARTDFDNVVNSPAARADAMAGLAQIAWQDEDVTKAKRLLSEVTATYPKHLDAWLALGELALAREEFELARRCFTASSELVGGRDLGQLGLARTALLEGDVEGAWSQLTAMNDSAGKLPVVRYMRGLVAFERGELAAAESDLQAVMKANPSHLPAMILMGAIKYRQGHPAVATDYLKRAYVQDGTNESVVKMLADLRLQQGDESAALALLEPISHQARDPQLVALHGSILERLDRPAEAIALYERAVAVAPDAAELRSKLAISLLASGQVERASAELSTAVSLDDSLVDSEQLLVLVRLRQGDADGAEAIVNDMLTRSGDSAPAYYLLALAKAAQKDTAVSEWALKRSISLDPAYTPTLRALIAKAGDDRALQRQLFDGALAAEEHHLDALLGLARFDFDEGRPARAEEKLKLASLSHTSSIRPRIALGRYYFAQGRRDEARVYADEAERLSALDPDVLLLIATLQLADNDRLAARETALKLGRGLETAQVDDRFRLQASRLLTQAKLNDLALTNLLMLRDSMPSIANSARADLARIYTRTGQYSLARAEIDLLNTSQSVPEELISTLLADWHLSQNQVDEARALLKPLVAAGERDAVLKLAMIERRAGNESSASKLLRVWLANHPADSGARMMLASSELAVGNTAEAARHYEAVLDTGRESVVALNNLAWLYLDADDSRAIIMARRAYRAERDNPNVIDTLGWVYLETGDIEAALEHLRRASSLAPTNPTVLYHLGVALQRKGEADAAREALRGALALSDFGERQDAEAALATLGG